MDACIVVGYRLHAACMSDTVSARTVSFYVYDMRGPFTYTVYVYRLRIPFTYTVYVYVYVYDMRGIRYARMGGTGGLGGVQL